MGKINVLSKDVAALIAAGEVVERPASAIKELIENSIDAGATAVTVEIKGGGISYMRVTDNGSGIAPEDVENAFLRHATSKISSADDLESIMTLGFRGEALHSIAAVSHLEIMTAQPGSAEGFFAKLDAGKMVEKMPIGCPIGTSIIIRDLFFNTPARMKFLKKDSTEGGYVEDVVRKTALGRPDISFKFINGGKEIFFTPGDNNLKNAVYAIYGRDIANYMIETEYEGDGVKVHGLIGKSELSRGNRNFQTFFVNGRCVINKSFYFALTEGYKNQIMVGRFPVAVLNIEINPALCDVNVHPAKTEIKFADDKIVYDALYWAVKNALYNIREVRAFEVDSIKKPATEKAVPPAWEPKEKPQVSVKSVLDEIKPSASYKPLENVKSAVYEKPEQAPRVKEENKESITAEKPAPVPSVQEEKAVSAVQVKIAEQEVKYDAAGQVEEAETASQETFYEAVKEQKITVIGQLFKTYIICEIDDAMVLIDQHAAHERIIYNRLVEQARKNEVSSQMLLIAETLKLSAAEFMTAIDNKEFFESLGFDIEEFGSNTLRISMVPTTIGSEDAAMAVQEMLDVLSNSRKATQTQACDRAMYTLACRAALKAGQNLSIKEQEELVKMALKLDGDPTCPHGRPIVLKLTKYQIEKQFKRIV